MERNQIYRVETFIRNGHQIQVLTNSDPLTKDTMYLVPGLILPPESEGEQPIVHNEPFGIRADSLEEAYANLDKIIAKARNMTRNQLVVAQDVPQGIISPE